MDGYWIRRTQGESGGARAVSSVIGVILMVAITVVLATVIGATVLDYGDRIGNAPVNAGVSIDGDGTSTVDVTLTNRGTADGVAIVDGDAVVVDDTGVLNATGQSAAFDDPGTYTVQAFEGTVEPGDTIDDTAQRNSIIADFDVEE